MAPIDASKPTQGVFDGLCLDGVGNIWVARWSDERIVGFSPDGKQIANIKVPLCKSPTIPCFGGESGHLRTTHDSFPRWTSAGIGEQSRDRPWVSWTIRRVSNADVEPDVELEAEGSADTQSQATTSRPCTSPRPIRSSRGKVTSSRRSPTRGTCSRWTSARDRRSGRCSARGGRVRSGTDLPRDVLVHDRTARVVFIRCRCWWSWHLAPVHRYPRNREDERVESDCPIDCPGCISGSRKLPRPR